MYQVSLKSEGGRPFLVITWPGITRISLTVPEQSSLYSKQDGVESVLPSGYTGSGEPGNNSNSKVNCEISVYV